MAVLGPRYELPLYDEPYSENKVLDSFQESAWNESKAVVMLSGAYRIGRAGLTDDKMSELKKMAMQLLDAAQVKTLDAFVESYEAVMVTPLSGGVGGFSTRELRPRPYSFYTMKASPRNIVAFALSRGWHVDPRLKDHFAQAITEAPSRNTCSTADKWKEHMKHAVTAICTLTHTKANNGGTQRWQKLDFLEALTKLAPHLPYDAQEAVWQGLPGKFKKGSGRPRKEPPRNNEESQYKP